jgi:hypothetical protein
VIDTSEWNYYYKLNLVGDSTDSNLLYTPRVNPEKNVMCMHYCVDTDYRTNGPIINEDLIQWFFEREVRFLNELSHFKSTPKLYEVDLTNRKIFIEWHQETLSQIIFNKDRNLDQELPDYKDQLKNFLLSTKKNSIYKMSLYPHCFYIDKEKNLKTIDYYAVVPYDERFIERKIIEGVIGRQGAYRFDESTNKDGYIDFKKFFKITLTKHLTMFWPNSPFTELFEEIYHDE